MDKKLVFVANDRPVTDSLTVADVFGKRHDRVLQDLRDLGCSVEFRLHHFVESSYTNLQHRVMPKFLMTEQGFTLLVMGYTGQDAMRFKEAYIAEFDRMRQELLPTNGNGSALLPKTYLEALKALVMQVERNEQLEADKLALEQCLAEAAPKLTYVDQILASQDTVCITQIAKDYGLSGKRLNLILHDAGVQYKINGQWVLYARYQHLGYTHSHTVQYTRSSGERGIQLQTEWTQKGRLFVHDVLTRRNIVACIDRRESFESV
ncbi:phage antirepressor KilAC domain-containing protein [Alicyclobacillus sp. SP_1]|uniref:phage antirepressor KilAC domain-containing protein n=1 Tax=Alicyclobacillus sp. SP_1 TaxID=2942475 RepID=UPI002157D32C|nr:phage antirepressor KilAC domain-containing protein [Alicyclobacillus sp. SP_1]